MIGEIAGGVLIGVLLGLMNSGLLRLSVRRGLGCQRSWKALTLIFAIYILRYLLIGLVVFALLKAQLVMMALTVLGVLMVLTVGLAIVVQQRKNRLAAKVSKDHASN